MLSDLPNYDGLTRCLPIPTELASAVCSGDDTQGGLGLADPAEPSVLIWQPEQLAARTGKMQGGLWGAGLKEELKSTYERMELLGPSRRLKRIADLGVLNQLEQRCANFREVIAFVRRHVSLSQAGVGYPVVRPILLLGPPGVGKTYFAQMLARLFETDFIRIDMATVTSGFVLSGNTSQWADAKPGMVAQALMSSQYANPVLMLDEIDKAENTDRHSTLSSLYTLLESTSSERFRDEFVEIEFNAKHVTWIMTANDKSAIPAPLLDRMTVFDIKTPNESQFEQLAASVYQECRNDCGAIHFPPSADAAVLRPLAGMSARAMRRTLESAMAAAYEVGRIALSTDDVCRALANAKQPARRIGFM